MKFACNISDKFCQAALIGGVDILPAVTTGFKYSYVHTPHRMNGAQINHWTIHGQPSTVKRRDHGWIQTYGVQAIGDRLTFLFSEQLGFLQRSCKRYIAL